MLTGLEVDNVTPAFVAGFLKTSLLESSLPKLLPQTELKTEERLKALLNYCQTENKLELPLLLTQDNILRVFKEKVFSSTFYDLVPEQSNLFLHQSLRLMSSSFKDFVKDFQLDDLVKLERFAIEAMKNPAWLKIFWEFVKGQMSLKNAPLTSESLASKIPDWKVLPVQRKGSSTDENVLQMKDAKLAIYFCPPFDWKEQEMWEILRKLNCWELNPPSIKLSSTIAKFSSSMKDFEDLSRILTTLDLSLLRPSYNRIILKYFEGEAPNLSNISVEHLRSLPLYETYDKEKVSLCRGKFRILRANLPQDGFKATQHGLIFLKYDYGLCELYKRLGLTEISELEVYSSYILDTFTDMNDKALLKHLVHLSRSLASKTENDSQQVNIQQSLSIIPVIGSNGNRKCASNFYSHKVEFFQKLLPKDSFLPTEYQGELFSLCKMIGLQCDVTEKLFLRVADDLAGSTDVEKKAQYLVYHLVQKAGKWQVHFLQQLSWIKFIPAHQVTDDLQNLNAQFKGGELICFKDSVPSSSQHLVWTSANLLPYWANQAHSEISRSLSIELQPTLEKVILHCRTLCNDLARRKSSETTVDINSAKSCSNLTNVMKSIYHFLMKSNNDIEIQTALKDVPIIVVEDGKKLVHPYQVIIEMPRDDLRPHLFKLPLELGEFHAFFCKLGATAKPTLKQFSNVLKGVYDVARERKLNPEEKRLFSSAIKRFFACLNDKSDLSNIESLYFLTKDGSLKNMTSVMFNDRPKFANRVRDYDCEDPETYKLDLKYLKALPETLRPKFLSESVSEKLHPDFSESCDPHDPSCLLKKHFDMLLSDLKFRQGLTRLAKHSCSKSGTNFDEIEMRRKLQQIGSLFIECRPQLQTLLFNSKVKEIIPGSENHPSEFVDEDGCIFIDHENKRFFKLTECFTHLITEILDSYYIIKGGKRIVRSIINLEDTAEIEALLNDEDIRLESNITVKKVDQEPGDLIDEEFLCFLTQNPSHYFKEGELVGYLQNDVYILARIVSETGSHTTTGDYNFGKKYEIDLGQDQVITFYLQRNISLSLSHVQVL
jgi:hypothetical protein